MGKMTIDGFEVEFTNEKNLLSVIQNAGIDIPTLCYIAELETVGDCRMCTVEDDKGRMFASCSEVPRDGMVIYTNTRKLRLIMQSVNKNMFITRRPPPPHPQSSQPRSMAPSVV